MVAKPSPSPSLIALKPRQVILSSNPTMKNKAASAQSLADNENQKSLLLRSVANFLQRNSFSKTLKKFLSEAQIQKDDLTSSSLDLEEMCCKYLAMSDHMQVNGNPNSDGQDDIAPALENATKKKKKGGNETSADVVAGQAEVDDKSANSKKSEEQVSNEDLKAPTDVIRSQLDESDKKHKEKKKKKSKLNSDSHVDNEEYLGGEPEKSKEPMESNRVSVGKENETKDKKKKKEKLTSETLNASEISLEEKTSKSKSKKKKKDASEELERKLSRTESKDNKDNNNGISKEVSTITDDKDSEKRKRLESEVNDSQPVDRNTTEDCKRRKTESSEACNKNTRENGEVGINESVKKSSEQLDVQENGNVEKNAKNSEQKSSKKQQNGSVQPKKPFQRVNVDEVVFIDKRLEDNSYWAKDGAEIGYGAKAQEVLGQVRGRDFRHEKTKKKRGNYRGGQIDFQSHSVKFNYSDDE